MHTVHNPFRGGVFAVLALVAFATQMAVATTYKTIDIGSLSGQSGNSSAMGINSAGQICGNTDTPAGHIMAFRWDLQHGMVSLGTLPGAISSGASGMNASGQVVGLAQGAINFVPVRWDADGSIHPLDLLPGCAAGIAYRINDAGIAVGMCRVTSGDLSNDHACLWNTQGHVTDLGPWWGYAINNSGIISGVSQRYPSWIGVTWDTNDGCLREDVPGFAAVLPQSINNLGHIVGNDEPHHAWFWNGQQTVDMGSLTGGRTEAFSINDIDQVAGFSYTQDGQHTVGWLWTASAGFTTIAPLPGGTSSEAMAINNAGIMAGNSDGINAPNGHAVIIVPAVTTPDTQILTGPAEGGSVNAAPTNFTFIGSDNLVPVYLLRYSWKLNNDSWSAWSTSTSTDVVAWQPGLNTFQVKTCDLAGNEDSTPAIRNFNVVYVTPPTAQINCGNPTWHDFCKQTTAIITWSGSDNLTPSDYLQYCYRLRYPTGMWSAWSSWSAVNWQGHYTHNFPGLADGIYCFQGMVRDAGLLISQPVSLTFIVDTVLPQTYLMNGPAAGSNVMQPITCTWTSIDNMTPTSAMQYSWRVDSTAWSSWTSSTSTTFTTLTSGSHTLQVKCRDYAQNESIQVSNTFSVTVDSIPPTLQISYGPLNGSVVRVQPITFGVVGNDDYTPAWNIQYRWQVDSGSWSSWSTSTTITLPVQAPGAHTFRIVARDLASNVTLVPVTCSFTIPHDLIPPNTLIATGPANWAVTSSTVTIAWTGTDNLTPVNQLRYAYCLQNNQGMGDWTAWSSATSVTLTNLPDGYQSFAVKAIDGDGNEDPTPLQLYFVVDSVPPNTYWMGMPSDLANVMLPAAFAWTGIDNMTASSALTYAWQLDNGAWSSWSSSNSLTFASGQVALGAHVLRVKARDGAGNVDQTPITCSFTVTVTAAIPDTEILTGPTGSSLVSTPVTFTWIAHDLSWLVPCMQYQWQIDGSAWSAWSMATYLVIPTLVDGQHTFSVRARNQFGNIDPTPASRTFIVDAVPPTVSLTGGPVPNSWSSGSQTFSWTGADNHTTTPHLQFAWRMDHMGWSTWSTATSVSLSNIVDGPHLFEVQAMDEAGNISTVPAGVSFNTDSTSPDVTFCLYPFGPVNAFPAVFYWVGCDNITSSATLQFAYRVDGGAWTAWSSTMSASLSGLTNGQHTIDVKSRDRAGNESTPAHWVFTVQL